MRRILLRSTALSVAVVVAGVSAATASGFMVRENSAESVGMVYAGNGSRADDVATVFNNPAGMPYLRGTQFEIGASVVFPDMTFTGNATVLGTPIPGVNDRSIGQFAMVPHIFASYEINDRFNAGIAITVPFGNTVDYSENWPGRYINIKTAAIAVDINPNISFRITDRISIAAGFSAQYMKLDLSSAIPQFLILGPTAPDGGYLLRADDWAFGYNLGVMADLTDTTRAGVTYRSAIDHQIEGHLHLWPTTSPFLGLVEAPASANLDLPASTTVSITQEITPELSLSGDVQFTEWHSFHTVTMTSPPNPPFAFNENYRDSWMVSVGGNYRLNPSWTLRAGAGYDQSPITDGFRGPGVPDVDRIMVGIGAGYHFTDTMSIDGGYAHYFAAGHGRMDTSINAVDPVTGAVILHGFYDNALDYLSISFRAAL